MTVGEKIRKFRKAKGWTQQQLADALGVKQPMIGQYENGKRNPKIETAKGIAKALGVSFTDLINTEED